jgi:uncharacterized protein YjbI with pentapeptide repeats
MPINPLHVSQQNCDRQWENPAKVIFSTCQCLCALSRAELSRAELSRAELSRAEYSVQRASQYLKYFVSYYILKCWSLTRGKK